MCKHALAVLLFFAISTPAFAQDATTLVETAATCCRVRVVEVTSTALPAPRAVIQVAWLRSDDTVFETRAFIITNGSAATTDDDRLWGTGLAGQPTGLMTKVGSSIADETGPLSLRLNKAVLRWLVANGEIPPAEITIP